MGMVKLELPCPASYNGITSDPQIDWNLDDLVSELNALELRLSGGSSSAPIRLRKTEPKDLTKKKGGSSLGKGFVMRIDDDGEDIEDNEAGVPKDAMAVRNGTRFTFQDLDFSEDLDDEMKSALLGIYLTSKPGVSEGTLYELKREKQYLIKEDIRNTLAALEEGWRQEGEKSASAYSRVDKYINDRKEKDKEHHTLYRRRIAGEVDFHLSAIQRDHEQLSRMEEKKLAEIKEKQKAFIEDKIRKEKAKEEEAKLKEAKAAEEAQKAYIESQRKAALEADERKADKTQMAKEEQRPTEIMKSSEVTDGTGKGDYVKASEAALKLEEMKREIYVKLEEENNKFSPEMRKALQSYERQMARRIKQISGSEENIRLKVNDLLNIINDPRCPKSISLVAFAKQIVAKCENPSVSLARTAFACGRLVVAITSEFPTAMDLILAEFHRACIYTVPKHIRFSEATFGTKEAYLKEIGYREINGEIETKDRFLERVEAYSTLYAALLQTEVPGFTNCHGLKAGWSWLARLLNNLPADIATATALRAFLEMAGFALHKKYESHFIKLLNTVTRDFIVSLKSVGDAKLNSIITSIEAYIDSEQFLNEPIGWRLEGQLLSKEAGKEIRGHLY